MKLSPVFYSDAYKYSHLVQFPPGTEYVYSNTTPRGSRIEGVDEVVVFGVQYLVKEYLINQFNDFFSTPKEEAIGEFRRVIDACLGKGSVDISKFEALHDLGYLPLTIKCLPEGSKCPLRVPFMTIVNTLPEFYWLTNFVETLTQTVIWQAVTSATIANKFKSVLDYYAETTGSNKDFVGFQGHDFSMRGMSSVETGAVSGAAHLLSFVGTDTFPAILFLEKYYNADCEKELIGCSVPATEHAVVCAGGEEDEQETFRRLIEDIYPTGIVSMVSDTWDFWGVLHNILPSLKDKILNRSGKLVVRPDCYDEQTKILTNKGWKFFRDLDESDLVAQVLDDGSREFVKPSKIVNMKYEGDMCHFTDYHGKVDLLVTPNHRMVILQNGKERIIEAEKMPEYGNHEQKMIRSASAPSGENKLSNLDRLRIAFQADGSFTGDNSKNRIRFSFAKQRKIDRLSSILDESNIKYNIYTLKDGRVEFNIHIDSSLFSKNFEWVKDSELTKEWCEDFIEECSYWDATRRSDNRFKFDTTSISVADKVEFIAFSAGYGVLRSHTTDDRSDDFSDVITLHILKDNKVGGRSWKKEVNYYSGNIYCVTVPTGKILVKRNRCTMVCGNSGDPVRITAGYIVKEKPYDYEVLVRKMSRMDENPFNGDFDCIKTADGVYVTSSGQVIKEHEAKGAVQVLWDLFGGSLNKKGFMELDPHIGLIYGDGITVERADRILHILSTKGFASSNVVFGVGSYCVSPETKILCSDFIWREAKSLKVGQEIISFDEDPSYFNEKRTSSRKYRKGVITSNNLSKKNSVIIETEDGSITCSTDHPFLVYGSMQNREDFYNKENIPNNENLPRGKGLIWKKAKEIKEGDEIAYFSSPWEKDETSGWLEGIFDGEGSLSLQLKNKSTSTWKVCISQNSGYVLDRIKKELESRGFSFYENENVDCKRISLTGGFSEVARFLGEVAPKRILDKAIENCDNLPALKRNFTYKTSTVKSVQNIGINPVSSISVSNGTFITNGFLSHNTYQYNTRDTFSIACKATWVKILGKAKPIFKDPKTDNGTKKSAKGLLRVDKVNNKYVLKDDVTPEEESGGELVKIFENGNLLVDWSLAEIRKNLA